jgi:transmembrane sensor
MSQENFWVLLSKKLAAEASSAELQELEKLLQQHPEWQYAAQNLQDIWQQQAQKDTLQAEDAYLLHLHRMEEMQIPFEDEPASEMPVIRKNKIKKWLFYAAAVAIILAGFFSYKNFLDTKEKTNVIAHSLNEISTRAGSKSKVKLPDGSVVWLNAGSKLTYTKEYGLQQREVNLTGEGYFDVKKIKEKPFIIHTSKIDIKVLGTVFNVKAYPEDRQTETSLIHGSIEVTIKDRPRDKIILSPSEKLVVKNTGGAEQITSAEGKKISLPQKASEISSLMSVDKLRYIEADSTISETAWVSNRLVFRNEAFSDVALRMQRWYDVEIEIKDDNLLQEPLSGTFENETVLQALDAFKYFLPFKYEQKENKIIIYR